MPIRFIGAAVFSVVILLVAVTCSGGDGPYDLTQQFPMTISVTSASFIEDGRFDRNDTCEGDDMSPTLAWKDAPIGTESYAIILEDRSFPGTKWTHWVVYGLSGETNELTAAIPSGPQLPNGAKHGSNDWEVMEYRGPCPAPTVIRENISRDQNYYFLIYALDVQPDLAPGATKDDLFRAVDGHVLAAGETAGIYRSKRKCFQLDADLICQGESGEERIPINPKD